MSETRLANQKPIVGRKKTSHAKCNFYKVDECDTNGINFIINNSHPSIELNEFINYHLRNYGSFLKNYLIKVWVKGGGVSGQRYAVLKSICRTLVDIEPDLKKQIKDNPYLWFDSRIVERKIFGRRKARRGQQWKRR